MNIGKFTMVNDRDQGPFPTITSHGDFAAVPEAGSFRVCSPSSAAETHRRRGDPWRSSDELIAKEARKTRDQQLKKLHVQFEQSRAHEKRLQERLNLEKAKLAELDRQEAAPDTQEQDIEWRFDGKTRRWKPLAKTGLGTFK